MANVDEGALAIPSQGLVWRPVGSGLVVYALDQERFVELNHTGRTLWDALVEGERSTAELAALLVSEFGIDPARARADVDRFVVDLRSAGLLPEG